MPMPVAFNPMPRRRALWPALAALALAGCGAAAHDPQAMLRDGNAAVARNDWHAAADLLRPVTDDAQTDPRLQWLAGRVALEQGDADRAVQLLGAVLRAAPGALPADQAAQVRPLLARAQLAQGNAARALETLGNGEPADAEAAAVKVRALAQSGNPGGAMALLDHALGQWPQAVDLDLLDALRAAAAGHADRADAIARDLLARAPGDFDVAVFAGQRALAAQRLDEAARDFDRANHLRPDHQAPMLGLAGVARARGDHAGEVRWIDRARHADAGNLAVALYAAQLALDAGHADQAAQILAPFATKPNGNNALRLLAGLTFAQVGRKEEAIDQLNAFLLHGGEDGRARFALAVLLTQRGDQAGAWRALKPLAQAANATAPTLQLAAALARATHDGDAAGYAARAAAAAAPNPDAPALAEAQAAIKRHDWAGADAIYTRLLANPHGNPAMLTNNAAFVKIELGQPAAAVPLARKALAQSGQDPLVMDTLGWALFKAGGARDEAVQLLQAAAAALPGNANVQAHLAQARSAG